MRAVALLSAGRHPASGKPGSPRVEMQAVRLAFELDAQAGGLHAGPTEHPLREALGRGLTRATHLRLDGDPLPALVAALRDLQPDVVLAGPRGEGGEDTGLTPYRLAHALGWPLVAQAVAATPAEGGLRVTQALPEGARRHVVTRLPALLTVHASAPAPLPFAYGRARAGHVETRPAAPAPDAPVEGETRPYRARPKAMSATGGAQGGGRVLINPDPDAAAREILAFLRSLGVVGPAQFSDDAHD